MTSPSEIQNANRKNVRQPEALDALSLSTAPIWVFDITNHRIWWANEGAARFWLAPDAESLVARDFSDDSETVRKRLRMTFDNGVLGIPTRDNWTLYPHGEPISVQLSMTPITIGEAQDDAVMIEITSVHDAPLDFEDRRLLEATRYTSTMISYYVLDGTLTAVNPAAGEAFGSLGGINSGGSFLDRFAEPAQAERLLEACRSGHEPSGEYLVRTRSGDRWHMIDLHLGRDPVTGERAIIAVEEDISSLKQALVDLEKLNRSLEERVDRRTGQLEAERIRAEQANQAKSDFLASMSHDLRTPLNAILGFSEILSSDDTQSIARSQFQAYGSDIHSAARSLLAMVDDLLDLTRIEAGHADVKLSVFSIGDLLEESLALIETNRNERQIGLDVDVTNPATVRSDRRATLQILSNLLSNAVKYTPIRGSISVGMRQRTDGSAVITVQDTGPGIPADEMANIFQPYVRGRSDVAREVEGTGLGLAICKRWSDLLGMDLRIEAPREGGTIATLIIPASISH